MCVKNHVYECLLLMFICRSNRSAYAGEGIFYAVTVIGHDSLQLPEYGVYQFYRKGG